MSTTQTIRDSQFLRLAVAHGHEALRNRQSMATMFLLFGILAVGLALLDVLVAANTGVRLPSSPIGSGVLARSLPLLALIGFSTLGLVNTAVPLAAYRAAGVLRQIGTTPVSKVVFVCAHIPVRVLLGLGQIIVIVMLTALFADHTPLSLLRIAMLLFSGLCLLLSLGYLVGSLMQTPDRAMQVAVILTIALITTSDTAFPLSYLPETLSAVLSGLPTTLFTRGLHNQITDSTAGFPFPLTVLVVTATSAVLFAISGKAFRWNPRDS